MGIRISEMEEAASFAAGDYVPIVSDGNNQKAMGSTIKKYMINSSPTPQIEGGDSLDCPFRTHTTVASVTITPGTWLIIYRATFGTASITGSRRMYLTNSNTSTSIRYNSRITQRAADMATDICAAIVTNVTENTDIYLRTYQQNDENETITASGIITAIKIIGD